MDKEISNECILLNDPVLRFLCLKKGWSNARVIGNASLVTAFLFIVIGSIASWNYKGSGSTILSLDNIGFILIWIILFTPLMWGAYLWQARVAPHIIMSLAENGIFGKAANKGYEIVFERAKNTFRFMSSPLIYLFTFAMLIAFWSNEFLYAWPEQFRISPQYWYEVKWYLPIHILAWSIGLYALFLFILRQVGFVLGLMQIFRNAELEIKPLYPDEVGGLGVIEEFVKSSVLIAIGIGFLAILFAIEVFLTGSNILRRTDVLALFGLYLTLAPFCLILPYLSVQRAMLRAREQLLEPIALEFQKTLEESFSVRTKSTKELKDIDEKLEQIKKHRELLIQVYPTAPLQFGVLRNFSISALIPLITGIIPAVIQFLT